MICCENCVYFKTFEEIKNGSGLCVRYAPRTGHVVEGADWPIAHSYQYCGEFVSRNDSLNFLESWKKINECP